MSSSGYIPSLTSKAMWAFWVNWNTLVPPEANILLGQVALTVLRKKSAKDSLFYCLYNALHKLLTHYTLNIGKLLSAIVTTIFKLHVRRQCVGCICIGFNNPFVSDVLYIFFPFIYFFTSKCNFLKLGRIHGTVEPRPGGEEFS